MTASHTRLWGREPAWSLGHLVFSPAQRLVPAELGVDLEKVFFDADRRPVLLIDSGISRRDMIRIGAGGMGFFVLIATRHPAASIHAVKA